MNFKINFLTFAAFIFSIAAIAQTSSKVLIEAEKANQWLSKQEYKFIDTQSPEDYANSHIAGAINIWRDELSDDTAPYTGLMPSANQLAEVLGKKGISNSDTLVIYDNKALVESARLWWILKSYYFNQVKLINGGLKYWLEAGFSTDQETPSYAQTQFNLNQGLNTKLIASKEDVLEAVQNKNATILDTRSTEEFEGTSQKDGATQAGRIPTSIFNDWSNFVNYNGNHKIKSTEELNAIVNQLNLNPTDPIIVYCHSGVRSAHTAFVLSEILGFSQIKNFDGSWVEWSYFKELPIEKGPALAQVVGDFSAEELAQPAQKPLGEILKESWVNFAMYTWREITFQVSPWYVNYFWWLIVLSLLVWGLEALFPWRKDQPLIRKDFWLDAFYMFFNFYIFKIVIFAAFSSGTEEVFKRLIGIDLKSLALIDISNYPEWAQLLIFFVATDFIQWFVHVMLHRFDFFWKFHKVHHSVEQMGFAAHLRYHWMENVFYTPMKYIAVMLIGGFTPEQAYIVFYIAIAIGHFNHANIHLTYGPLKYIFNNPVMHLWHHVYNLPEGKRHGINFGISLSIWDYIFKTASIPKDDAHIKLGFPGLSKFPKTFGKQLFYGFKKGDD